MGLMIDGIAASEHLDSSGEILKIDGHDISDLVEGKGVINFEHDNSAECIIGHIIYAKKIKKKSDCEDGRQEMFWDACKVPFVYIRAELFDDEEHPGAVAAAAMIRYYKKRGLKVLAGFSVEGATLDKDDNVLKRSVGRRVALTLRPCNKSAVSDVYEDPKNKEIKKFMQLDKPIKGKAYEVSDIIFEDVNKSEHIDKLHGGKADKKKPSQFNQKDLEEGVSHEMEHTNDRTIAQEIAMDHLTEDPSYYKKLKTIEKSDHLPTKVQMRNRKWAMEDGLHKNDLSPKPTVTHNQKVRDIADSYAKKKGFNLVHNNHQVDVHPEMAKKVAQAYHEMPHTPNDPATQKAYKSLIDETKDQYEHLKQHGFKFSKIQPGQDNPYKSSKDLFKDVHENNHAWYFPTESGFGSSDQEFNDHPLLQKVKTSDGDMHANDLFRVVHDVFGHAKEGNGFGPKGEENAYRHHMQMYSPEAQKALTSETRGQNSWVNFGPHSEHNRANPANTIYAQQKAGLMPDWTRGMWNAPSAQTKKSEDPFHELRESVSRLKKTLTAGGSNVAPSNLTGGAALVLEDRVGKKKKGLKPETEKKLKNIIATWDGKSSLAATIKACLPEVSDNYIDHFANLAEEYTLKKAVNHIDHCDNENASIAQDNLITGINVFMNEGKEKFFATNYAGKPVLVVCSKEDDAKRATRFYEFVCSAFPKYSAMVPLTNYLKHPALAMGCAYVQLMPEGYEKNNVTNPDYYGDFRRDSWMLHGFALIDLISGAYQDRTELDTLCGEPPMFLGNTKAFYYDNFGGKPFYLKLIGNELLHMEAVSLLESIDPVDLSVLARYSLQLNPGEIKTMVGIIEKLKAEYHGKTINQLFNIITDGIKNEA